MSSSVILVESSPDSMTFAWAPSPSGTAEIELKVNDQEAKTVSLKGNLMKKKNMAKGDRISIRIIPSPLPFHFIHTGESTTLPPPRIRLETMDEHNGTALVEFDPVPGAAHYQVDMFPLSAAPGGDDWIPISDALKNPGVKKKNLSTSTLYSFRYRAFSSSSWGSWSIATIPQAFPAPRPKTLALAKAISPKVIDSTGAALDAVSRLSGKVVGLYFSASWCGPCRKMTPQLQKFSQDMARMGREFEIVFVSLDHDVNAFREYFFKHMPGWLAIPYEDADKREELQTEHRVNGIPSLKILSGKTGKVVEANALQQAMDVRTFDSWQAKM